jgi:hypothetical protein
LPTYRSIRTVHLFEVLPIISIIANNNNNNNGKKNNGNNNNNNNVVEQGMDKIYFLQKESSCQM